MVVRHGSREPKVHRIDRRFNALADPTRRDILRRVLGAEQSVSALAEHYPMSFAAVQKHVAVLERAELVGKRRRGREQMVRGDVEALRTVNRLLDQYEAVWRNRIDRMDEIVAARPTGTEIDATPTTAHNGTSKEKSFMTLKDVKKDPATLTVVVTAQFSAPVERVWQLWADPRQLERWWGPPTYPATVVDHDLVPGATVTYFMTGPEGDKHHGWWRVLAVDPPHSFEVEDGFADDSGTPDPDLPSTTMRVELSERDGVTDVVTTSTFPSLEAMEQLIDMGMEDGLREAMAQMDDVLAA